MNPPRTSLTRKLLSALAGAVIACAALLAPTVAAAAPAWTLQMAHSPSSLERFAKNGAYAVTYTVSAQNSGDEETTTPYTLTDTPPAQLSIDHIAAGAGWSCPTSAEVIAGTPLSCTSAAALAPGESSTPLTVVMLMSPSAPDTLTNEATISGGGGATASAGDPSPVSDRLPFGIKAFDAQIADAAGNALTQAAAHPASFTTSFDINTYPSLEPEPASGKPEPIEDLKDATVSLPAGFVGGAATIPQCTATQLTQGTGATNVTPLCPEASQLGVVGIRIDLVEATGIPIFNMVPPPGVPARFGFNVGGDLIMLDSKLVRGGEGGYHLTTTVANIQQGLAFYGNTLTFWGVPSDPSHDSQRHCAGTSGSGCASPAPAKTFFRNPTSCTPTPDTGLAFGLHADSWQSAGVFSDASVRSHQLPGYSQFPEAPQSWGAEAGIEECAKVPFEPTITAQPSTNSADSPSGLSVDVNIPGGCWAPKTTALEVEEAICQSDLKDSVVTLPQGLTLNPSASGGREACTPAQAGLTSPLGASPVEFDEAPVSCPNGSKIGAVEIKTPLVDDPLKGFIYLAQQEQNPFKSLVANYVVAEGSGVRIKLAAKISLDKDGRVTTTFADAPQTPFTNFHLEFYGGPRATLRTPPTCGTYTTQATFTPWSGNAAVNTSSSFQITNCGPGGFDPKLSAGTQNPLAGSYSPFSLRLSREDGTQELSSLRLAIPPGLVANLKDISYCPDATLAAISSLPGTGVAQIKAPSCPAASQLGTATAASGAGPNPFYAETGKAYWAGPYKGAPVSLAVVVPAVAGPFDLGNVVVRNGFEVNPESAQITAVSDPFPQVLHGIPLDLRDIRINLDRPDYTLNPTSCDPLSFEADISSTQGAHALRSQHFQAASCDRLAFKPKLALKLSGPTSRGSHPALRATLTMPPGGANLAGAVVALPHSEFLDQGHIGTVCTRVQYAAGGGGGEQCPKRSIYGSATAYSPILGYYLKGNAYLRSSSHTLPDLVLGLHGPASQPVQVDAVGRIDSTKGGGIRTSFESVPDVPVSKVVLEMRGAKKGLLQNSTDICQGTHRANATLTAHNADRLQAQPELKADCGPKARKGKGKAGSRRP